MTGSLGRLYRGWERFWFEPQSTSTLALFRIALGAVCTVWTLTLAPDLFAFFGSAGVLPEQPELGPGAWGLLSISATPPMIVGLFVATLLGSLALLLGLHTRLAAIVVFVCMLSFHRRNWMVFNSGDLLLLNLTFFCMLAPAGAALSIDRLRAAPGRFWEFPTRAPWALRLVQIQVSLVYLSTVWQKVQGAQWRDGTAFSYAMRIEDIHRFPTPRFIVDSAIVGELLTFGTLALELGLALLVWNRAIRPWIMALGVVLHVMIELSMTVGFFSVTMLVAYLAFARPEQVSRLVLTVRDRLRIRRSRTVAVPAQRRAQSPASVPQPVDSHR